MSGILRLESLTKGNTLKQGDETPLKYRLFDADGEKLNIAGKSAVVRLMYPDFLRVGYESEELTVSPDNTVTFSIDKVIQPILYYLEITVDDKYIFPSRNDESKLNIDKSSKGSDVAIIEIVGKDVLVRDIKNMVDSEIEPVVNDMIISNKKVIENEKIVKDVQTLSEQLEARQNQVEQFNNQVITEMTDKDVISAPEIISARGGHETLDARLDETTVQLTQTMKELSPITSVLGVSNDGSEDISLPLRDYAADKDEIYLFFPQGRYRWDNNIWLKNKKVKLIGHNAVIEHYASGTVFNVGDEVAKNCEVFHLEGITMINKKPKPASRGTGVSSLQIRDCLDVTLKDVRIFDSEQYGINFRVTGGNIGNAVLDNVRVERCSGNLATTTSIALETKASGTDGRIKNISITNSYFEVTDTYTNESGGTSPVGLSNACKLQGCDNVEMANVTFVGGKENGALSFIHEVKKVNMVNVKCKSTSLISAGMALAHSPELELNAVNCDLGVENFVQSISTNGTFKKIKLVNCKLQRITVVTGIPDNFEFHSCEFNMNNGLQNQTLQLNLANSKLINCVMVNGTRNIVIPSTAIGITLDNVKGVGILEVSGSDILINGGEFEAIRPNGSSTNVKVKAVRSTSDYPLRSLTSTTSDWTFEHCVFEKTIGGLSPVAILQGTRMKVDRCSFRQLNKTDIVENAAIVINNSTDCQVIEKRNTFDVNKTGPNIDVRASTGFKQYDEGDIFYNAGIREVWNGTAFESI